MYLIYETLDLSDMQPNEPFDRYGNWPDYQLQALLLIQERPKMIEIQGG